MAHGTPLAVRDGEGSCGSAGPFLLPVGISSSYHIAKFFGIATSHIRDSAAASRATAQLIQAPVPPERRATRVSTESQVLHGEVLHNEAAGPREPGSTPAFSEIGEVINKALRAAGLIRNVIRRGNPNW